MITRQRRPFHSPQSRVENIANVRSYAMMILHARRVWLKFYVLHWQKQMKNEISTITSWHLRSQRTDRSTKYLEKKIMPIRLRMNEESEKYPHNILHVISNWYNIILDTIFTRTHTHTLLFLCDCRTPFLIVSHMRKKKLNKKWITIVATHSIYHFQKRYTTKILHASQFTIR